MLFYSTHPNEQFLIDIFKIRFGIPSFYNATVYSCNCMFEPGYAVTSKLGINNPSYA
jgi:hypothetical protein